jgi:hypothetical protein
MKKTCSNCDRWKRYLRMDNRCLCEILCGGNYYEVYTTAKDTCKYWKKFTRSFNMNLFKKYLKRKMELGV